MTLTCSTAILYAHEECTFYLTGGELGSRARRVLQQPRAVSAASGARGRGARRPRHRGAAQRRRQGARGGRGQVSEGRAAQEGEGADAYSQ